MLFVNGSRFIPGYILTSAILFLFAARAYRVNAKRPDDDPKKRDFHIVAIFLTPITWPLIIIVSIILLIIRLILYILFIIIRTMVFMLFLILFTISVIAVRKPFLLIWIDRIAIKIGNYFLAANTMLIKAFIMLIRVFIGRKASTPKV